MWTLRFKFPEYQDIKPTEKDRGAYLLVLTISSYNLNLLTINTHLMFNDFLTVHRELTIC